MAREVSTVAAARCLGVSPSTVLNLLRAGRLAGRRGEQPRRPRWYVAVDDAGRPLAPDGQPFRRAVEAEDVHAMRQVSDTVESSGRAGVAREVALRLKAAGERQRRALQLQAEALNELAAALDEQGEAIAQLLLPNTVAELTSDVADDRWS